MPRVTGKLRLETYDSMNGKPMGKVWADVRLDNSASKEVLFFSGPRETARRIYEGNLVFEYADLVRPSGGGTL